MLVLRIVRLALYTDYALRTLIYLAGKPLLGKNRLMKKPTSIVSMFIITAAAVALLMPQAAQGEGKKDEDPAVARTRKQVKMLDDLYKTAVVLITTHYVEEDSDLAAGEAAIALFAAMKAKGWHEVRLLDATGDPIEKRNSPQDAFEKAAVKSLLDGQGWHEEIVKRDNKRYLRAATPIPVVLKKCVMCHDHYKDVPQGQAIGALSYTIEIE